jgi:hypothetical protein
MVATYNSSLQAINLSAIDQPSVLRFSEPAHDNFWFEADLRLNSDAIGQRHIGLWMCTGQSTQGYRFAHASGNWSVSRFDADFQDGALVGPLVRDGATPIAGLTGLAPSFNPGSAGSCAASVWWVPGTARARQERVYCVFFAGGVQICVVDDVTYPGALIPGVCLQGATARIESIAGAAPSTLAALGSQVGLRSMSELRQLASPCGQSWDQVGGPGAKRFGLPMLRRNIHFGGDGYITGTIKEKGTTGQADQPLERQVLLMSDNTRTLVAQTWSDAPWEVSV